MWFIKYFNFFQKLLSRPGFKPGWFRPQRIVLTTRQSGPIVLQGNRFHFFSRFRYFWRLWTLSRQTFMDFCLAKLISVYFSYANFFLAFSLIINQGFLASDDFWITLLIDFQKAEMLRISFCRAVFSYKKLFCIFSVTIVSFNCLWHVVYKFFIFFPEAAVQTRIRTWVIAVKSHVLTARWSGPIVQQGNRFHIFSRFRCFWRLWTLSRQTFVDFCLANLISVYFSSAKISCFFLAFSLINNQAFLTSHDFWISSLIDFQ